MRGGRSPGAAKEYSTGLKAFASKACGKRKVNVLGVLYCTLHNILKVHGCGYEYA